MGGLLILIALSVATLLWADLTNRYVWCVLGITMTFGAIGLWDLRRYLYLLMHAEEVANQANCPHCGTYARFELLGENRRDSQIEVRCRKCASQWHINF